MPGLEKSLNDYDLEKTNSVDNLPSDTEIDAKLREFLFTRHSSMNNSPKIPIRPPYKSVFPPYEIAILNREEREKNIIKSYNKLIKEKIIFDISRIIGNARKNNQNVVERIFINDLFEQMAVKEFEKYVDAQNKKRILFFNEKDNIGSMYPLKTKYSNVYIEKVNKRMSYLAYKYRRSNAVLVTLTVNPWGYKNNVDVLEEISKKFDIFEKRLYRRLSHRPPYIKCIEFMSGREENNYIAKIFNRLVFK